MDKWFDEVASRYPLDESQTMEKKAIEEDLNDGFETSVICIDGELYFYDNGSELAGAYDKAQDKRYID